MNLIQLFLESLASIKSNKLRVFLSAAIISIGISSLVGILTSIDGIKSSVTDSFSSLGSNVYTIESSRDERGRNRGIKKKNNPPLKWREIKMFVQKYNGNGVVTVNTYVTRIAELKYKSKTTNPNISVSAGDFNLLKVKGYNLQSGRNFTELESNNGVNVAIIGSKIIDKLFEKSENPINKVFSARGTNFRIIGVLEEKGSSFGRSVDDMVIIPLETGRRLRPSSRFEVEVRVDNPTEIEKDMGISSKIMSIIRQDPIGNEKSFEVVRNESLEERLSDITGYLKIGGFSISFITLLGASIGLMNIMLVSVNERTREIGIRKSIGATPIDIKNQFLTESIVICQLGGVGGVLFGLIFGIGVTWFMGGTFSIPWLWILLGIIISTLVGIISGYIPANRASKLDPIESLRYE